MSEIFNSLNELLTKLNELNELINSNKLLNTLKIIENCINCKVNIQKNYFDSFYESLNKLKNILEELDKEKNEDREAEIIHKLSDELNKLDVKINIVLCYGCQKKNTFDPLYELLTKLNESSESIISNKLLDTLKIIEDCTSCSQRYNYYYLFYESLNELKKVSEELIKEENEDRKAEIIHKLNDELNKLDVKINRLRLCYGCQKKNILNPLYELLTKLNESNESINSNKLIDTLKIIENCTSCAQGYNYYYLFYESLNELKKISEELGKKENEDKKIEIIHKLNDELNKLDVKINRITLCYGCQKKNILNPLYELLIKLNESDESIISNKLLDTLKIIEDCTSCSQEYNYNYLFYESLNELKKISEELDKEENEDKKAEIIHKLSDELNELDVEIIGITLCYGCSQEYNYYYLLYESLNELKKISEELVKKENEDRKAEIIHKLGNELNKLDVEIIGIKLCYGCQKKNILNPLYELLTKLNELNESINPNKLLDTLKSIEDCTSCLQEYNYYYLFYESLNELKKISEELDKEENEDRKAEIIHKLCDELNKLDVEINKTALCDSCHEEKNFNSLNELLTKLNENKFDSFCKLLNKLKKISEELGKEENEDRKAEIIHQLGDELNKLDVKINRILCDGCQKEIIFDPLCELLTRLNESNASINSNKLLDTLKIIEDCTGCKKCAQKNYYDLFYESLNKLKKDLEELDKEENEDRKAEIIHKLGDELNELDVEINRIALCHGCQEKNIFNPLCKLLTKLNESNEPINSNKLLDTLKILENYFRRIRQGRK
ncbi:2705_t:CDS:2 [Entrophospora sp. SA101]|nr:2705_t:CDS:2 [Entrophospora sp. SA101]